MTEERTFGTYFGEAWPSGVCDEGRQVPTPVGELCCYCGELIEADHQGTFIANGYDPQLPSFLPQHKECSLRSVMGGIGHIEDHARWCLKEHDPDGARTPRQSSLEVWEWVQRNGVRNIN